MDNILKKFKGLKIPKMVIIVCFIGVALMLLANSFLKTDTSNNNQDQTKNNVNPTASPSEEINSDDYGKQLVSRLESFLTTIEGAGEVKVILSFDNSIEKVLAYDIVENKNDTVEIDKEGGNRTITQDNIDKKVVYIQGKDGSKIPVFIKDIFPHIQGIVITCQGGASNVVKEKIKSAITALYDISPHKIEIFSMKN